MSDNTNRIDFRIPLEAKAVIEELAKELSTDGQTVKPSDIVREAVAAYLKTHEKTVSLHVSRGGYRGRRAKS